MCERSLLFQLPYFCLKAKFFLLWRLLSKDNFLLLKQVMNGLTHKKFQEEFFLFFQIIFKIFGISLAKRS